jgi:hypothetical protein
MSKESLALQERNPGYLALFNSGFSTMMAEELDGLDLQFEKIKIPSGGVLTYVVTDEDGEADTVKAFTAVILHHHPVNAYYKTKFNGGHNPPDCGSYDGVSGSGDPGGSCKACPYNQYDSGKNGGKACQNRRRLFVLREGEVFPMLLSLPTGSLGEFGKYLKRLISKGRKSNTVVTKFSLKKATSKGGVIYSQAQFSVDRALAPEEHSLIATLSGQVKEFSGRMSYDADAPSGGDDENGDGIPVVDNETGEVMKPLRGRADV